MRVPVIITSINISTFHVKPAIFSMTQKPSHQKEGETDAPLITMLSILVFQNLEKMPSFYIGETFKREVISDVELILLHSGKCFVSNSYSAHRCIFTYIAMSRNKVIPNYFINLIFTSQIVL